MTLSNAYHDRLKGLYAITDDQLIAESEFTQAVESALQGGASIIQYRDKSDNPQKKLQQAHSLHSLCERYQAILIINDDIELAKTVKAHGVHLGKNDVSISSARQILGDDAIIGISCYNNIELAIDAEIIQRTMSLSAQCFHHRQNLTPPMQI